LIYMQRKWCKGAALNSPSVRIPTSRKGREKWGTQYLSDFVLHGCYGRLIVLVSALEIGDLVIALEVPDAGGHFVDQVMIVGD